jgi:hypothetical protein
MISSACEGLLGATANAKGCPEVAFLGVTCHENNMEGYLWV